MKKLLLGRFLTTDELYVVDEKNVRVAVFLTKFLRLRHLDGFNQLICKIVAFYVEDVDIGVVLFNIVSNRVKKVGFSKSGVPIDKKGIISSPQPPGRPRAQTYWRNRQ